MVFAYGTRNPSHWLNVPAGRLGWDPAHESGFVEWLRAHEQGYEASDFVPRRLLGDYLETVLGQAIETARQRGVEVELRQGEVIDVQDVDTGVRLQVAGGGLLPADQVVLACGHLPPAAPDLLGLAWGGPGLVDDPWNAAALSALPEHGDILVLGSGLTAIDVATALLDRGP